MVFTYDFRFFDKFFSFKIMIVNEFECLTRSVNFLTLGLATDISAGLINIYSFLIVPHEMLAELM